MSEDLSEKRPLDVQGGRVDLTEDETQFWKEDAERYNSLAKLAFPVAGGEPMKIELNENGTIKRD